MSAGWPIESRGGALVESPGRALMTAAPTHHPLFGISNTGVDQSQDQLQFSGLGASIFEPYGDVQLNQEFFWFSGVWSNMFWPAAYGIDPSIPIVIKTYINAGLAGAWSTFFNSPIVNIPGGISSPVPAGDYCYLYANVFAVPNQPTRWQLSVWRIDDNYDQGFPGQWFPSVPDKGPMPLTIGGICCYPSAKPLPTYPPITGIPGFHYTLPGFHQGNSITVWEGARTLKGCVSLHNQVAGGKLSPAIVAYNLPQAVNIPFCIRGGSAQGYQSTVSIGQHVLIFWIGLTIAQLPAANFDPTLPAYAFLILQD